MQKLLRACCCLLLLPAATTACKNRPVGMGDNQDKPTYFATPEEAVRKAKEDFLSVLRSNRGLNLGVDAATLERAQAGRAVTRVDLNFDKVVAADSAEPFDALAQSERNTVVPFVTDDRVATIVEVRRDGEGWRVVGLAGKDIADELNIVRTAVGDTTRSDITLYEVPNLQTRVYGVKRDGRDVLFTDFGDRFTLRQGVSAAELIPALKAAAVEFQREYGEILKQRQLLR